MFSSMIKNPWSFYDLAVKLFQCIFLDKVSSNVIHSLMNLLCMLENKPGWKDVLQGSASELPVDITVF